MSFFEHIDFIEFIQYFCSFYWLFVQQCLNRVLLSLIHSFSWRFHDFLRSRFPWKVRKSHHRFKWPVFRISKPLSTDPCGFRNLIQIFFGFEWHSSAFKYFLFGRFCPLLFWNLFIESIPLVTFDAQWLILRLNENLRWHFVWRHVKLFIRGWNEIGLRFVLVDGDYLLWLRIHIFNVIHSFQILRNLLHRSEFVSVYSGCLRSGFLLTKSWDAPNFLIKLTVFVFCLFRFSCVLASEQ